MSEEKKPNKFIGDDEEGQAILHMLDEDMTPEFERELPTPGKSPFQDREPLVGNKALDLSSLRMTMFQRSRIESIAQKRGVNWRSVAEEIMKELGGIFDHRDFEEAIVRREAKVVSRRKKKQ